MKSTADHEARTELTQGVPPATAPAPVPVVSVPVRHPWRWVAMGVVALLFAMLVYTVFTNPNFRWSVVRHYSTSDVILDGLWMTLLLTVLVMVGGVVLGIVLAVLRLSPNPVLSGASGLYIWFFRGTPVLVQLILWFNLAALFPTLSLGVPFGGPQFVYFDSNALITPFVAALLGLGLNEAAYMAEIVRAGIQSVDEGQTEAAQALGLRRSMIMRRVVLPQAMRVIIPPTGNETISMLKTTSLVSVISLGDLLYSAQIVSARTFEVIPMLLVASIWYLIVTTLLTLVQARIERRYSRGSNRGTQVSWRERFVRGVTRFHAPPPATDMLSPTGGIR